MGDARRSDYMIIFVILAIAILAVQIISSIIIYLNVSKIPNEIREDMNKVDRLVTELDSKLNQLNDLNQKVSSIESNIIALSNKYPPNQTVNINNVNQNDLNRAINNAINLKFETISGKVEFNFWFNIIVGLSLIGVTLALFGRKKWALIQNL